MGIASEPLDYENTISDAVPGNGLHKFGFVWPRLFGSVHPYEEIEWERRTAKIAKGDGTVVFEQQNVEVPSFWTQTATDIVASKYFRGRLNSPDREYSVRQMVDRVADTMTRWGLKDGYFASAEDAENFSLDLKWILINQYAAFNSPVWFNVGVHEVPQCSACQPYHALISTSEGMIPIGEIVSRNLIGQEVYDAHGVTKVIAVKANGKKNVYKIKLANGSFIEATGDHLVKAVQERRTNPFWARVDQLNIGMKMHLYPHREGFLETEKNFNLISEAALAGWLQADGFVGKYDHGTNKSLTVEFETVNQHEREWVYAHLAAVFPNAHSHERTIPMQNADLDYRRIRIYGGILEDFVNRYDLLKSWQEKRVPKELFTAPKPVVAAYLKSIFQADGYVGGKNTSIRIGFAVISPLWAEDIQVLLFRCGIYSRRYLKREKRENRQNLHVVEISIGSEREKFFNLIGFIDDQKQKKLADSLNIKVKKNCPDLREETIISIEDMGIQEVYDIQTESGEYLSNNIAVHNCFILAVEDNMQSILDWYRDEGWIFKFGSGAGLNLSKLRSSKEALSKGGYSSGPVSFMKGADGVANSIRSGGTTRRAAKMVVLNVDHPDIKDFIYCKKIIEDMTKALARAGIKDSITADIFDPYTLLPYQNANNSVRVTDEFMKAVENDSLWHFRAVTSGESIEKARAREVLDWMADAAWESADPGIQFDTTINDWHTCPNTGRINASNPCVTGDTFIATKDGLKRIKNLVEEKPEIVTLEGNKKASKVWQTGTRVVYKLTTKAGYSVKVTADHKINVVGKDYIEAKDIKPGDRIPLLGSGFGSIELDQSLAMAVGYAVGDGCISHKITRGNSALTWVGGDDDKAVLEQIAQVINYNFISVDGRQYTMPVHVHQSTPGWKVVTSRPDMVDTVSKYSVLDRGSINKKFTDKIFNLDKETTASTLSGLFTADGTVSGNKEKGYYVGLDSSSIELLEQVQLLLLNFGIKSKIYRNRRTKSIAYLPDSHRNLKAYPVTQMHSLRITRSSRIKFENEIGFVSNTPKAIKLTSINLNNESYLDKMSDEFDSLVFEGIEAVYDLTEPVAHHFSANGLVVHNCSEYMHLDNSACNLASLNLLKFLNEDGQFNVDLFRKAVDTMILAQDIVIDNSSYPTEKITKNAKDFRELGLGYANLGSLLMNMGLPYDSEKGRSVAGQVTSLMCGEAYRMSALISDVKDPFNGYELNREPMLGVIEKHLDESENTYRKSVKLGTEDDDLLNHSRIVWNDALTLGKKYGIRNSQVTVLAPTGTIAFLMDCDTTGIEPELALVKYKKLVGGGTLKLVNNQVPNALRKLGYSEEQIDNISNYLLEKETIEGAPYLSEDHLPVFDCSFKAMNGTRSIHYMGHVKMMAAAQPFISGAISKTVNLPSDATREDIKDVFFQGWKLGLKAIAVYRDGCKSIQPLNTSKDAKDNLVEKINGYTRVKLPDERPSVTHKFSVGGFESYLTVGFYPDSGKPGETFIATAKEGSTVSGLFDTIATLVSMCLQSGVPLKVLVKKFKDMRFEPSGFTNNPNIPTAKSVMDYVFRYIGMKYLSQEEREELFGPSIDAGFNATSEGVNANEAVLASAPLKNTMPIQSVVTNADAPACANCGSLMIKAGSCYSCPNCFTTTGVCN